MSEPKKVPTVQPAVKMWAAKQKERFGWSYRDMAAKSGLAHSTVAMFFKPDSHVGFDACQRMAAIFGTPILTVFELAELIPKSSPETQATRLLTEIYSKLDEQERVEMVNFAEYLRDKSRAAIRR